MDIQWERTNEIKGFSMEIGGKRLKLVNNTKNKILARYTYNEYSGVIGLLDISEKGNCTDWDILLLISAITIGEMKTWNAGKRRRVLYIQSFNAAS